MFENNQRAVRTKHVFLQCFAPGNQLHVLPPRVFFKPIQLLGIILALALGRYYFCILLLEVEEELYYPYTAKIKILHSFYILYVKFLQKNLHFKGSNKTKPIPRKKPSFLLQKPCKRSIIQIALQTPINVSSVVLA